MFTLFDSHCHLQFPHYDADRAEVLSRMQEKGMGAIVIGTDLKTSGSGLALAKQHDFLWAAVGLHPNDPVVQQADYGAGNLFADFAELAKGRKVVAIGECGLDYFRTEETAENKKKQKERFLKHIKLAEAVGKPLIIHCRNAHDDMLEMLAEHKPSVPVIIHFFTGTAELAQNYIALGCYLSYPGPVTYTDRYDEAIRATPLEKLLIETDAPFAAPVPNRGKRNEPAYAEHVVAKIATVKGMSTEGIASLTAENAAAVFRLHGSA